MSNLAEKLPEGMTEDTDAALCRRMQEITIADQDSYGRMAEIVKEAKDWIKGVKAYWEGLKASALKQHRDLCAKEKEQLAPFEYIAATGQGEMNRWLNEEDKRRKEEERQQREEAAALAQQEQSELNQSADTLEKLGDATGAAALRQQAESTVPVPVFVSNVDKTVRTGAVTASAKKEMVVEVTDKLAFLGYLLENKSACVFVEFRASELKSWVRSNGFKAGEIPGLAIEERLASAIR